MALMTESVSFGVQQEVQLRFLSPEDLPEVKKLCAEWFPIEYGISVLIQLMQFYLVYQVK